MKVKIGPYKKYYTPYDLESFLVEKMGLSSFVVEILTWPLYRACDFLNWVTGYEKGPNVKVRIDEHDTWSADYTLSHIIYPLLDKLKDDKHSVPRVDNADVPEYLRTEPINEYGDENIEGLILKWNWVLYRMMYSFAYKCYEDEAEEIQYEFVNSDKVYKDYGVVIYDIDDLNKLLHGDDYSLSDVLFSEKRFAYTRIDFSEIEKHNKYIQEGFEIFGKYYQSLWT